MKKIEGHTYDFINTAMGLVQEVAINGLSTNINDICRAQDIIGHSTVGELEEVANSRDEFAGKRAGNIFYFIIFEIWDWERATRFWNEHSNPEHEEVKELRKEKKELAMGLDSLSERFREQSNKWRKAAQEKAELEIKCRKQEEEILRLKARLFDLMDKTA